MYREHFGLTELPFSIAPNPRYLYLTHQHQEALAHLVYGLNSAGGIILLTGEVGTGKTTISRKLLEDIPDNIVIAWIVNPRLSVEELLAAICDELSISYPTGNRSIKIFTDLISDYLIFAHGVGRNVVLMIDEAQNLSPEVLEQLRLLTNLETNERKLLQIVLLGQPELKTMLERSNLRQLAQRITARYHLHSLSRQETCAYIRHRLAVGGCSRPIFTPRAMKLIYHLSHGTPRLINLLSDRAMLGVYSANAAMVHPKHVRQASIEVLGNADIPKRYILFPVTITMLLLATFGVVFATGAWQQIVHALSPTGQMKQATMAQTRPRAVGEVKSDASQTLKPMSAANNKQKAPPVPPPNRVPEKVLASKTEIQPAFSTALQLDEVIRTKLRPSANHDMGKAADLANLWEIIERSGTKALAMQTLAEIWHTELDIESVDQCQQLVAKKLFCLSQVADIWRLKELDRPAIFEISNHNGDSRYAVIRSISNGHAMIQLETQQWVIKLSELKQRWKKEITLLWHKPPGYSIKLRPGDSGTSVTWLAKQLDRIQGTMIPPRQVDTMDTIMVERLKDFQQSEGLTPDGIAGVLTLMRLNARITADTPLLQHMVQN